METTLAKRYPNYKRFELEDMDTISRNAHYQRCEAEVIAQRVNCVNTQLMLARMSEQRVYNIHYKMVGRVFDRILQTGEDDEELQHLAIEGETSHATSGGLMALKITTADPPPYTPPEGDVNIPQLAPSETTTSLSPKILPVMNPSSSGRPTAVEPPQRFPKEIDEEELIRDLLKAIRERRPPI